MSRSNAAASRACLAQGLDLLDSLDDEQYARRRGEWSPIGAHYRHLIEHYQCLLEGLESGKVDYDARRRDVPLEVSRTHAQEVTRALHRRLGTIDGLAPGHPLQIQTRTSVDAAGPEWTSSTLGRELQFLVSHTVHHFALIKLLLAPDGIELPAEFGTAPSTVAHNRALG
jgi:hypothetical protein